MNHSIKNTASPNILHIYYLESKIQLLKMVRTLGFSIPTLLFPIIFYTFFGIIFSLIVVMLLFTMAALFAEVELYTVQWVLIALCSLLGALPFCAIGMTLGLYLKSSSAPAIVNLIYLPMSILSGLWMPINFFPETLQYFANVLPAYHLAPISLKVIDMDIGGKLWIHISVLLVYLIIFTTLAIIAYNKKDKK